MVAVVPSHQRACHCPRFRRSVFSCAISVLPLGRRYTENAIEDIIFDGVPRQDSGVRDRCPLR